MDDQTPREDLPDINIGDPLYRLLHDRLHLHFWHVLAFLTAFNIVRTIIIPAAHHAAHGSNFFLNAHIKDVQSWVISFISQPIILWVYWTSVERIPRIFRTLQKNDAIRPRGQKTVAQLMQELENRQTSPVVTALAVCVVVVTVVVYHFIGWSTHRFQGPLGSFPYNDFQQYVIETIHGCLRFWFVTMAILRGLLAVDMLRIWWRNDLEANIHPLHPDGAGGLGSVADITLESGLLVGAIGLFLGTTLLVSVQNQPGTYDLIALVVLSAATILVAPAALVVPLWATHRAMIRARRRQLMGICRQFDALWAELQRTDNRMSAEAIEQAAGLAEARLTLSRTIPIWPIDSRDLRRYGLSLIPLFGLILSALAENLVSDVLRSIGG